LAINTFGDSNLPKSSGNRFLEEKMANYPNPDYDPSQMERDFGTKCLITNPIADYYLEKAAKPKNNPPKDRLSRPCGGKGGFDDYAEWLT
jgi:hypothetical protein